MLRCAPFNHQVVNGQRAMRLLSRNVNSNLVYWLGLLTVVTIGALLRLAGYDFSLPYVDHPDEPNFILAAQMIIDHGSAQPMGMQGYPPGVITLSYLPLKFFPQPEQHPLWVTPYLRILTILVSAATALPLASLARMFTGSLGGLLTAGIWLFSPELVTYSRYFTPDPYVTLLAAMSLWLALKGAFQQRTDWLNLSLIAWAGAVLFKYQALFILPVLMVLSALTLTVSEGRPRFRTNLIWQFLGIAAFGLWLTLLYPSLEANDVPHFVASTDRFQIPTPIQVATAIGESTSLVGTVVLWTAGLAGVVLCLVISRLTLAQSDLTPKSNDKFPSVIALGAAALLWTAGVSFFGEQDVFQNLFVTALLTVFLGTGVALLMTGAWKVLQQTILRPTALPASLIAVALLFFPLLDAALASSRLHSLHDRRNDLAAYMDTSLEAGSIIATADNHKTFNRDWGGYRGLNEFPLVAVAQLDERPLDEWRTEGVAYAIMSTAEFAALTDDVRDEITLLKTYPVSDQFRGPDMVVVCLCQPDTRSDVIFGPIHLTGYTLERNEEALRVQYFWRAQVTPSADYVVFNHLLNASGELVSQQDGAPHQDERRGTSDWNDPSETLISAHFTLSVEGLAPGDYRLVTGFYRRDTGERMADEEGRDSIMVSTLQIP